MKNVLHGIYNYFRMFRKDNGAHFTYNLGVGFVRVSFLFFLWAGLILAEWIVWGYPRLHNEENVKAEITMVEEIPQVNGKILGDKYKVYFKIMRKDGTSFEHWQWTTFTLSEIYLRKMGKPPETYHLYALTGRHGEPFEPFAYFVSNKGKYSTQWDYYFSTPDADPPVQTWGIWVSLAFSLVLFMMGRRQIIISMKYPRTDVPVEVSGAPEVIYNEDYFREQAKGAVREDMRGAAEVRLLSDNADGRNGKDPEGMSYDESNT